MGKEMGASDVARVLLASAAEANSCWLLEPTKPPKAATVATEDEPTLAVATEATLNGSFEPTLAEDRLAAALDSREVRLLKERTDTCCC